ncbi:MAG: DUF2029 domain-containing protein [Chloroflexi bacterium]|nr:DUF2029 domain-containing protein [Chloroflexota bacterium]
MRRIVLRNSLRALVISTLIIAWFVAIAFIRFVDGDFRWIGYDFTLYRSQSAILLDGLAEQIYDVELIDRYQQMLAVFTSQPDKTLVTGTVPYLPLYAWLFTPFAATPPLVGFALWTALNLLGAVYLAVRASWLFAPIERVWVASLILLSFPFVYSLTLGQPTILLGCAMAECYIALRSGKELRAGLWLACLILKPQLAMLLGLLLLWKRRWTAVAGAAVGVVAVLIISVLTVGLSALLSYQQSLIHDASGGFAGVGTNVNPLDMVNWRSLILAFVPQIDDTAGLLLTLLLGLATSAVIALVWRGPWNPDERDFPSKMALLLLGTVLVSYHIHGHGAVILAVPLAAMLVNTRHLALTRTSVVAGVVLPSVFFILALFAPALGLGFLSEPTRIASRVLTLAMLGGIVGLLAELRLGRAPVRCRGSRHGLSALCSSNHA